MLAHLAHIDLTSVNQDAPAQAKHAVAAAVSRLDDGRTDRREVVLDPTWSSAAVPDRRPGPGDGDRGAAVRRGVVRAWNQPDVLEFGGGRVIRGAGTYLITP